MGVPLPAGRITLAIALGGISTSTSIRPCIGYLGYPFENTRGKSNVENLARNVDREEKTWVELIIRAHVLERISQIANTTTESAITTEST